MFSNPYFNLALLAFEILILYSIGGRVSQYLVYIMLNSNKLVKWGLHFFWAPGVTMHEASHAIVVLMFGGSVNKFVPYWPRVEEDGSLLMGYVEHGVARPNPISGFFIGIAPLIGVPLILFLIGALIVPGAAFSMGLAGITKLALTTISTAPISISALTSYLFIYLLISGSLGLLPSESDHRDLVPFLVCLGIIVIPIIILGHVGIFAALLPGVTFLSKLLLMPSIVCGLLYYGMSKHQEITSRH